MVGTRNAEELKKQPEADLVVNYIVHRKRKGLYSLILVSGLPGSGKSSQCQRLGEKVSEKILGDNIFNADCVVDSFLGFVKIIKNAKASELNICVIEEVSVLFPSRRAMATDNVDLAKLLDTCRKKEVVIFANAPIWTSIDSHMRSMANVFIQAISVYKKAGIVHSKCYKLQTDPRTGKTYTHNFKRGNRDVNRMYTLKPNKETWENYEGKKDSFLDEIYSKAEAKALDRKKKDDKLIRSLNPTNIEGFTSQELQIFDAVKLKGMKQSDVGKAHGVSQSRISQIMAKINKNKESY